MNKNIPTYELNVLSEHTGDSPGVFFLNQKLEIPKVRIDIPFRSNYYKIGICLEGRAELKANLETHDIRPGSLIILPPVVIKQWTSMPDDYKSLDIFFTKDFITNNNTLNPDQFPFFERDAHHVIQISDTHIQNIATSLRAIKQKYDTDSIYRDEILKNLINGLLYEIASIYSQQAVTTTHTRSQYIASEFKKLVNAHFKTERSLSFYAENISITPKHLTETVKEVTDKTAGDWITEAILLEAKVLLRNPTLTIAQISDLLHFTDQSTFGRFFKKSTGLSPVAYKQSF
jgi:AraC-like DNA-binding protein